MDFSKRLAAVACAALLSAPFAALADDAADSPISWEIGVVSDYLFRAVSQTDENPTAQASLTWNLPAGFYVVRLSNGTTAKVGIAR